MFRLEYSQYLWMLWIIPILIGVYVLYWQWRKRQINKMGQAGLLSQLINDWSPKRSHVRMALWSTALLALIIAYTNPQWGSKKEKIKAKSSDIFIALDISNSMMAEDISPNRLERAKRLTEDLIKSLKGNRIGLILFAGHAYLQMPLSNDYSAAMMFVASANVKQATTQGTAISEAIDLAMRAVESDKPNQRGLIIITDGEDHEAEALTKAKEAQEKGMNIFTIGVGTTEGAFIPIPRGPRARGDQRYKRDENNNAIKSALNIDMIENLAEAGGGRDYLIGEGSSIITDIRDSMDRLQKEDVETRAFTDYESYFQYFLAVGFLLLIVEYLLPETKKLTA